MIDSISEQAETAADLRKAKRRTLVPADLHRVDRPPPHAPEAEQGILGCIQADAAACMAQLEERRFPVMAFYDLRHRAIFEAWQKLYASKHGALDLIALMQTLKDVNMLEEVGGIPYLNELQDAVPSAANLIYYHDIVVEKAKQRNLIGFGTDLVARAYDCKDVNKLLGELETDFQLFTQPMAQRTEHHIKEVLNEQVLPLMERHYNRGSTQLDGLPTGKDWYLDKVLLGIAPSDYVILAGRPGEGKTSLALNIVEYLAADYEWTETVESTEQPAGDGWLFNEQDKIWFRKRKGIPVGVFTLEMTEASLGFRLVFSRARVSSATFRQGFATQDTWNKVNKAVAELKDVNIYLDGEPDQTIDQIAAKARRWARQYGIKLFVLDYLQLLDGDENGDNDRVRALRKISKKIVMLKKRLHIPWLVLAQMNRNIETAERARRPVMSDLKESGSLEQDADKIVILYHPLKGEGIEEDEAIIDEKMSMEHPTGVPWDAVPRRINALVVKNRNGPTGPASFLFQNNQCLFLDWRQWKIAKDIEQKAKGEREPEFDQQLDTSDYGEP